MSPDRKRADRRLGGAAAEAGSAKRLAQARGRARPRSAEASVQHTDWTRARGLVARTSGSVFLAEGRQPVGRRDDVVRRR